MEQNMNINDELSFKDSHGEKHGLRGHVSIYREDPETKKLSLWDESDNIIPISGYQWILMKMFDLYLDSDHKVPYVDTNQDTTVVIPDLNYSNQLNIGKDPSEYSIIETNIPENHFIQGFMVGNQGGSEDGMSVKNTDYSFTKLRNPIPFQQTDTSLDSSIQHMYLGKYRIPGSSAKSYYIKKFDGRPHIVHSWWRSGQSWDYIDPVSQSDLGPNESLTPKTDRIETYVTCPLSISDTDCQSFFANAGSNEDPIINELGLVAYDATFSQRSILSTLYTQKIKILLNALFVHTNDEDFTSEERSEIYTVNNEVLTVLQTFLTTHTQDNIQAFYNSLFQMKTMIEAEAFTPSTIKTQLTLATNIHVTAYYNQNQEYVYEVDEFMTDVDSVEYTDDEIEEAQRIKLITYYTFKAIPIQSNTRWVIDYRIYAN